MIDKEREEFLKLIKVPTKEEAGGEIDYSNVFWNARLQSEIYERNRLKKKLSEQQESDLTK